MNAISSSCVLTAIEGNRQWLDGGAMFGNAPRAVWEKWFTPDAQGRIELACRALLIELDSGTKILCETGIGAFFEPKLADRYGVRDGRHLLLKHLAESGIAETDIDFVILSHLHFDHAGGLLPVYAERVAGGDRLLFPNARYVVGRQAWERALKPHLRDRASFIPGMTDLLTKSGRLIAVDGNSHPEVIPAHIRFWYSEGHTPGQMHTIFSFARKSIFFAGDLIPGAAWVHQPITMGYDRYPEKLIEEKGELYATASKEDWLIFFTHDPKIDAAKIHQVDGRWQVKDSTLVTGVKW